MATSTITLKIGTVFSGEGLTKLQQGVKEANNKVRSASSASAQLSTALAGMDSSAAKAASAFSGLINAWASGGVVGAATALTMSAINWYMDDQIKKANELKERVAKTGIAIKEAFSTELANQVKTLKREIDSVIGSFDRATAASSALFEAGSKYSASLSTTEVYNLELQKFQAVINAVSDAEAKHTAAAYDIEIAETKAAATNREAADKVLAAEEALTKSREREVLISNSRADVEAKLKDLNETLATTDKSQIDIRKQLNTKIEELSATYDKLSAEAETQAGKTSVLSVKYETALQDQINVRKQQELAVEQAIEAEKKVKEEEELRILNLQNENALAVAKIAEDRKIQDLQSELATATQSETDARTAAAKAAAALAQADAELKTATENYNKNIATNMAYEAVSKTRDEAASGNVIWNGMKDFWQALPSIKEAAANVATEKGLKDGSIRTVSQMQKVEKAAAKQADQEARSEAFQASKEAATAARLSKMSDKMLSKQDKEWLDKYRKTQEANEAQKKAKEEAEAKKKQAEQDLKDAQKAQVDAAKDIAAIKDKLSALGLK